MILYFLSGICFSGSALLGTRQAISLNNVKLISSYILDFYKFFFILNIFLLLWIGTFLEYYLRSLRFLAVYAIPWLILLALQGKMLVFIDITSPFVANVLSIGSIMGLLGVGLYYFLQEKMTKKKVIDKTLFKTMIPLLIILFFVYLFLGVINGETLFIGIPSGFIIASIFPNSRKGKTTP